MKRICRDVLVFSLFAFIPVAASGQLLRTVAISDDAAPGTLTGVNYSFFDRPTLNVVGQVAFTAGLSGPGVDSTNNEGIWSEGSGILDLVARAGEPAPGVPGQLKFSRLINFSGTPLLNSAGQTAFSGAFGTFPDVAPGLPPDIPPLSFFRAGIWIGGAAGIELVARSGDPVPDAPDGTKILRFLGGVVGVNDAGQVAFDALTLKGTFAGGEQGGGIFLGTPESFTPLIADERSGFRASALTPTGEVAFLAPDESVLFFLAADAVLSDASGTLQVIAQNGDLAPNGGTFSRIGVSPHDFGQSQQVNHAAGRTTFIARFGSSTGIWKEESGTLALVVQGGQPAPGTTSGIMFHEGLDGGFDHAIINAVGEIVFRGQFTDNPLSNIAQGEGVWSDSGGSLALVALEGNPAPGAQGMTFEEDFSIATGVNNVFSTPAINAAGQVAFFASLSGFGQSGRSAKGIWAEDRDGTLQLIARTGEELMVEPGDFRTVDFLSFQGGSGNEDGRSSGFNDLGQVAFSATFTDGSSGVFVSNLVAVPEPSTGMLLLVATSLVSCSVGRRRL